MDDDVLLVVAVTEEPAQEAIDGEVLGRVSRKLFTLAHVERMVSNVLAGWAADEPTYIVAGDRLGAPLGGPVTADNRPICPAIEHVRGPCRMCGPRGNRTLISGLQDQCSPVELAARKRATASLRNGRSRHSSRGWAGAGSRSHPRRPRRRSTPRSRRRTRRWHRQGD